MGPRELNEGELYFVRRFAGTMGARGIAKALNLSISQAENAIAGRPLGGPEPQAPKENREFLDRYRDCIHKAK
jgi:hypothetical protein